MRILQVIESFGAGSMQVALEISERLSRDGHAVAIAHGRVAESPRDPRSAIASEIDLFELRWGRSPRAQVRVGRQLRALAQRWRPDVVHLHSSFAGFVGAAALSARVPLVYTPHGYSFDRDGQSRAAVAGLALAEHLVARRVDLVGAVSVTEAAVAARIRAPHVPVVLNGIAELDEPAPPPSSRPRPPRVVTVGRIAAQRRPAATAGILAGLRDVADVEWVGGGEPELVAAVRERGVAVSGWLTRPEVLERLAAAEACLHWSAWDAQPLAVLEAMARDVVVVASDISANRELLGDRQVCASEQEAAALLRSVLTDFDCRAELLDDQRRRRGGYSARRMAADWEAVYAGLAGGGRSR
jgi:glycosyltransferase involved in cell wall biosynthesis